MNQWNLDDESQFTRILTLELEWAHTYADMTPGKTDRERRERLRGRAVQALVRPEHEPTWWAFRIAVWKTGRRAFDIENVPKPIIDSFCTRQIAKDGSMYPSAGLYPDDTVDYVRLIELYGERCADADRTKLEVFAYVGR